MPLEIHPSYLGFKNSQQQSGGFVREGIVIPYKQAISEVVQSSSYTRELLLCALDAYVIFLYLMVYSKG